MKPPNRRHAVRSARISIVLASPPPPLPAPPPPSFLSRDLYQQIWCNVFSPPSHPPTLSLSSSSSSFSPSPSHQVKDVSAELGIGFLGLGFHPSAKREDIPIMPKVMSFVAVSCTTINRHVMCYWRFRRDIASLTVPHSYSECLHLVRAAPVQGRYNIMRAYMPKVGSLGLEMMLRTCTIQVR